jgi:CRISPR-associated protein Cst2
LVAASGTDRKKIRKEIEEKRSTAKAKAFTFKRDSVLRMNMAKALEPYRYNAVFTQSPLSAEGSAYKNAATSALLHRETVVTAFQYPFALNLNDCKDKPDWTRKLLKAIGELNDVAGNHARSYFEMAPASIIIRLTERLVAGFRTYCFQPDGKLPDVVEDILKGDTNYPANEFYVGGEIVKRCLKEEQSQALQKAGVTLDRDPRKLLDLVANKSLRA